VGPPRSRLRPPGNCALAVQHLNRTPPTLSRELGPVGLRYGNAEVAQGAAAADAHLPRPPLRRRRRRHRRPFAADLDSSISSPVTGAFRTRRRFQSVRVFRPPSRAHFPPVDVRQQQLKEYHAKTARTSNNCFHWVEAIEQRFLSSAASFLRRGRKFRARLDAILARR